MRKDPLHFFTCILINVFQYLFLTKKNIVELKKKKYFMWKVVKLNSHKNLHTDKFMLFSLADNIT